MGAWNSLLNLLYPPKCALCGRLLSSGEYGACAGCRRELPKTERGGGQTGEFFSVCISPFYYEGALRRSFLEYKFGSVPGRSRAFGRWMGECAQAWLEETPDFVTWAPLSRGRRRRRGFDQAELLAREAAGFLGVPLRPTLKKVGRNRVQSTLSGEERRGNVIGVYRLRPGAKVEGSRILLVDDIITTGSTLSECARVLRTAGAASVTCLTLARGRGKK